MESFFSVKEKFVIVCIFYTESVSNTIDSAKVAELTK